MTRLRILPVALLATFALATPAQAAKSVKGKWKGTVHSGNISFPMKMTIKKTKVGSTAGTLSNPGSPCHGKLTVTSHRNGGISLQYHETSTSSSFTGDDKIFDQAQGREAFVARRRRRARQVAQASLLRRA